METRQSSALLLPSDVGTKIVLGGLANNCGCTFTHPFDTVKVRLQLQSLAAHPETEGTRYLGFRHGFQTILQEEGFRGVSKGLTASLLREGFYSGIRFGLYDSVKDWYEDKLGVHHTSANTAPIYIKILAGATSGAVGSALANPMDLVKVRMQGDRAGTRYNNKFLFAIRDIYQHDGLVKGFYRGTTATTMRAMALTAAQLPSYDHSKAILMHYAGFEEGFSVHAISSMIAGLAAATASSPLDVMKTKIMHECSKTAASAENFHASQVLGKVFVKALKEEGIRGFFKGFLPNWMRLGPHTMISLLVYEELRKAAGIRPV